MCSNLTPKGSQAGRRALRSYAPTHHWGDRSRIRNTGIGVFLLDGAAVYTTRGYPGEQEERVLKGFVWFKGTGSLLSGLHLPLSHTNP